MPTALNVTGVQFAGLVVAIVLGWILCEVVGPV